MILDVLDIPDDFGEKIFFDHVTFFVTHTLFFILDILDIPGEFEVKNFFYLKRFWTYTICRADY